MITKEKLRKLGRIIGYFAFLLLCILLILVGYLVIPGKAGYYGMMGWFALCAGISIISIISLIVWMVSKWIYHRIPENDEAVRQKRMEKIEQKKKKNFAAFGDEPFQIVDDDELTLKR